MPSGRILSFLLHLRYILGNLAGGFLVAVPAQLILRGKDWYLVHSLAYGIVFLLAFVILIPLSRMDWKNVTVPEFVRFERATASYAAMIALALLAASFLAPALESNRPIFWFVFAITSFGSAQKWTQSWLFHAKKEKMDHSVDPHAPTIDDHDTTIRHRR